MAKRIRHVSCLSPNSIVLKTFCKEILLLLFYRGEMGSQQKRVPNENDTVRNFPGSPVIKTALPLQRTWVGSLMGELRSHNPRRAVKNKPPTG